MITSWRNYKIAWCSFRNRTFSDFVYFSTEKWTDETKPSKTWLVTLKHINF